MSTAETSAAALRDIQPKAPSLRKQVEAFILGRGAEGATDEEIQHALDMVGNTQRPRRRELVKAGAIVEASEKRLTSSNKEATVWIHVSVIRPKTQRKMF